MTRLLTACAVLCGVAACALAQEKPAAVFKTKLSMGLALASGNSESLQANASLITEGEKAELGSVRAGIEANYGESTVDDLKSTTVENARIFANAKKTISPKTFGFLDVSVLYDKIAQTDYRATLGPGLGTYLVKNDKSALSVEVGPSYVWENVADVSDDYLSPRFAERFTRTISASAKAWQSLEFLPNVDDFGDYNLTAEIGAEAAMTSRMNLRLVLQDKYDSTPGAELKNNDLSVIAGVSVSL